MERLARGIVRLRVPIFILSLVLLIPAAFAFLGTKINYDMLSYLPKDIDTMKGQDILVEEFGTGAFSMVVAEGMPDRDVEDLVAQLTEVEHVKDVLWYGSVMPLSVPAEMLPDDVRTVLKNGDATLLFVIYDDTSSSDEALQAVRDIRPLLGDSAYIAGMTPILADTQDLTERETLAYVALAGLFSLIVLSLTMDNFLVPFLFLLSIGMAIVYNLGTNFFFPSISFVTKALAAVLQLGVTMDYSIFLWHSFEEKLEETDDPKEAMAQAITATFSSVVGSSITTVAGFLALCFMSFTLGIDLGIVMAKGVIFGVICCVTVLPSMVLIFHKLLAKAKHRALLPDLHGIGKVVTKAYPLLLILYLVLLIPSLYGNSRVPVYYNLDSSLPEDLPSIVAKNKLDEDFEMNTNHILMMNAQIPEKEIRTMAKELQEVDGVSFVLGINTIKGTALPEAMIPDRLTEALMNENWQLLLVGSEYQVASDEVNAQCDRIQAIAKTYDENSLLVGEAPGTYDLIKTTDKDFTSVNSSSIIIIFVIVLFVFGSISIPAVLVLVIEGGILLNMAIPYYMGTVLPFVASIVIGTIQLGSTVDYAILMTTRYMENRRQGAEKREAIAAAVDASAKSIIVSALSFFAATLGVCVYSTIDMIKALCIMMARGALISMGFVIFILPAFLMIFDKLILLTTWKGRSQRPFEAAKQARLRDRHSNGTSKL